MCETTCIVKPLLQSILHVIQPITCENNNYGGTLGGITKKECARESVGGYLVNLWIAKNSNGAPLQCFKQFLMDNQTTSQHFDVQLHALKTAATNLAHGSNDLVFDRMLTQPGVADGFGGAGFERNWNKVLFTVWSMAVQEDSMLVNGTPTRSGKNVTKQNRKRRDIEAALSLRLRDQIMDSDIESPLTKCIDELIPLPTNITLSVENHRWWRERGLHLTVSKMADSVSSLLKSLPGSLAGVLPPSPTALYSVNAVLGPQVCSECFVSLIDFDIIYYP